MSDRLIVVCHTSHGRVVAGIATLQNRDASVAAGKLALQQFDCVLFAQHLFQIAQIQQTNDFAWSEIEKQFPQRFAPAFGPQVETSVGDGSQRKMNHTLVWSKPAERWIVCQLARATPKACPHPFKSRTGDSLAAHLTPLPHYIPTTP